MSGDETVMTGPEQDYLSDEELIGAAVREAHDAGLIGDEWPQVPESKFVGSLYIGEWEEA